MKRKDTATKRAKPIKIYWQKVTTYNATYKCPSCKTHFEDNSINSYITRFKCSRCEQELIIKTDHVAD